MGNSILVFISHSSADKDSLINPIVKDLEDCYINVWLDKRKILPGENLRTSILKDGLDKADVALIFFTEHSLNSSWVNREIKHVLREKENQGNNFDLNKIISIYDSDATYKFIQDRHPELTDDLLHLMPADYTKIDLGKLISAIWSKYLNLQGGDVATQKQLLEKDRQIFQREKTIQQLNQEIQNLKSASSGTISMHEEFEKMVNSGVINNFIRNSQVFMTNPFIKIVDVPDAAAARSLGLIAPHQKQPTIAELTLEGQEFFKWIILQKAPSLLNKQTQNE